MELRRIDNNNRNEFYEIADEVVQTPARDDVVVNDPEYYMGRLHEISSPSEQIKQFALSVISPDRFTGTHEGQVVRETAAVSVITGWLVGSMLDSKHLHTEYARQHNASVFDNNFRARRHRFDTFIYTMIRRGMPMGVKAGLLCLGASFIGFSSITVRARLYYPDWAVGFAALGATSRSWLGLRGLIAGGGFGIIGGTLGYGLARALEISTGKSVAEMRYHAEVTYAQRRNAVRDRLQRQREGWIKEQSS